MIIAFRAFYCWFYLSLKGSVSVLSALASEGKRDWLDIERAHFPGLSKLS